MVMDLENQDHQGIEAQEELKEIKVTQELRGLKEIRFLEDQREKKVIQELQEFKELRDIKVTLGQRAQRRDRTSRA